MTEVKAANAVISNKNLFLTHFIWLFNTNEQELKLAIIQTSIQEQIRDV